MLDISRLQEHIFNYQYHGREMSLKDQVINNALGLVGEAGEVADLCKKQFYLNRPDANREAYVEEIGDVLWHLLCLSAILGIGMREVIETNQFKIERRFGDEPFRF